MISQLISKRYYAIIFVENTCLHIWQFYRTESRRKRK